MQTWVGLSAYLRTHLRLRRFPRYRGGLPGCFSNHSSMKAVYRCTGIGTGMRQSFVMCEGKAIAPRYRATAIGAVLRPVKWSTVIRISRNGIAVNGFII